MIQKLRVVLYLDATPWAVNGNDWLAVSKPSAPIPGVPRYQIVAEIPDPRAAVETVRAEVTDVTPKDGRAA